jgi:hypothetical protein
MIRKPGSSGDSNNRPLDKSASILRFGAKDAERFHTPAHPCCDLSSLGEDFLISSFPGLNRKNISRKKVQLGKFRQYSVRDFLLFLDSSEEFNGHFSWFFLCNELDSVRYCSSPEEAVGNYLSFLNGLFRGLRNFKRIYIITFPFRFSNFANPVEVRIIKDFNEVLRRFARTNCLQVAGIPVQLLDLSVIWEDSVYRDRRSYCSQEKNKVHFCKEVYLKYVNFMKTEMARFGGYMFSPSVISRPLPSHKASMVVSAPLDARSSLKVSVETSKVLSSLSSQASDGELSPSSFQVSGEVLSSLSSQASGEELSSLPSQAPYEELFPEIPGREFVRESIKAVSPPESRKKKKKGRRSIFSRSTSDFNL